MKTPTQKALPHPTKQYVRDSRWIQKHIEELLDSHPNQWVAVHKGALLAAGPGLGDVAAKARGKTPATDIVFQFIDDGSLIY